MTTILILILVGLVVFWFVATQRQLVNLDELSKNALSQIDVQLQSRWDALLALAQMAARYASHEAETLTRVISERRAQTVSTAQQVGEQEAAMQGVLGRLLAVREAYPELKADAVFKQTMNGINQYEEQVRTSRMVYNDTATKLNRYVRQWPSSIVASTLHFGERAYLKVEEGKAQYPDLNAAFGKQ